MCNVLEMNKTDSALKSVIHENIDFSISAIGIWQRRVMWKT